MIPTGFLELVKISDQIRVCWRPRVPRYIFIVEEPSGTRQIQHIPADCDILHGDLTACVSLCSLSIDEVWGLSALKCLICRNLCRRCGRLRCVCGSLHLLKEPCSLSLEFAAGQRSCRGLVLKIRHKFSFIAVDRICRIRVLPRYERAFPRPCRCSQPCRPRS